jgi:predicted RND superfamily exporter protein
MAYTFRRAYKAILATSSTTAAAFLSNGFSTLMPVSAFGYFAFVIVPVNYVLIVFYFPAFLIHYENWAKGWEASCNSCLW